jgi:glycosyltransferase involved in cell wall biosynthesis
MKQSEKKRLAFVSDAVWPYNKGGKEKRLCDISTRLAKDFDVHIYTMKWWKGENTITVDGVNLHAICKKIPLYSGKRRSIRQGIFFGLATLKLIIEKWDKIDVDHMPFFPLYFVKLVCLIKGKNMMATWHEVWGKEYWKKYLGRMGTLAYLVEKYAVNLPDKIISISDHTTEKLKIQLNCARDITTIPIGVDIKKIVEIKPNKNTSDLIYAGRLLSHKNIDVLISATAEIKKENKKIKVTIIGDGPEKKNLEKQVSRLKLNNNVIFLGNVATDNEVYGFIKSAKLLVIPSSREGFGVVAIEAFACGVPVITVDEENNAAKELVKENFNGAICKLQKDELVKTIKKMMTKNLRDNCLKSAEKYSWNTIIEALRKEYEI